MLFSPCVGLSSALKGGIASASVTFFLLVVFVVAIVLIKWQSKLKKGELICIHRLIASLVLAYFICMCLLEESCSARYSHCLSYHWSSLVNQVSWIHQPFAGLLLSSSVAIVVSVYCMYIVARVQVKCLSQWLEETTSWLVQVVVGDVTVHVCKWSICANGTMKNATSASCSHWHPPPMHKVQGLSKNMCSHTSCIDCCCIVLCWSGQWWW